MNEEGNNFHRLKKIARQDLQKSLAKHRATVYSSLAVLRTERAIDRNGIGHAHNVVGAVVAEKEAAVEQKNAEKKWDGGERKKDVRERGQRESGTSPLARDER